jgi:hypothetical protein
MVPRGVVAMKHVVVAVYETAPAAEAAVYDL